MANRYSIAEARDNLASIVHDVEQKGPVELTRRGRPVAVLMSLGEFNRLRSPQGGFTERLAKLRTESGADLDGIDDADFGELRDLDLGREVDV